MSWVLQYVNYVLQWLKSAGLWIPEHVFNLLCHALVAAFDLVPSPSAVVNLPGLFAAVPSGVWWFAGVCSFGFGVKVLAGAYVGRFVLRRIPFIGG